MEKNENKNKIAGFTFTNFDLFECGTFVPLKHRSARATIDLEFGKVIIDN